MGSTGESSMVGQDQLQRTESIAKRDRRGSGKPQLNLVLDFGVALEEAARGLQEGVDKYGRGNWKAGFPLEEILDSAMSHLTKHMAGEMFDPDSATGATHLGKFLCNALLAVQLHNPKA